jgi:hypothetical protein
MYGEFFMGVFEKYEAWYDGEGDKFSRYWNVWNL